MAKSLSRIMDQIEKLQKEAAAIRTGVVARIRKEISDHGLSVEHLFGKSDGTSVGGGLTAKSAAAKTSAGKKKTSKGALKPPKFGDGAGNFWGGMGKRPEWLRSALDAGRSLEEFLIGGKKTPIGTKKAKPARKAATKASVKAAPKVAKKASSSVKAKAKPATTKPSATASKPAAKKTAQAKRTSANPAKVSGKVQAKKTVKAKPAPAKSAPDAVA